MFTMIFLLHYCDSIFLSFLTKDVITPPGMMTISSDGILYGIRWNIVPVQPSTIGLYYRGCHLSLFSSEMAFPPKWFLFVTCQVSCGVSVLLKKEAFSYSVWLLKLMTHLPLICSIFRISGWGHPDQGCPVKPHTTNMVSMLRMVCLCWV